MTHSTGHLANTGMAMFCPLPTEDTPDGVDHIAEGEEQCLVLCSGGSRAPVCHLLVHQGRGVPTLCRFELSHVRWGHTRAHSNVRFIGLKRNMCTLHVQLYATSETLLLCFKVAMARGRS